MKRGRREREEEEENCGGHHPLVLRLGPAHDRTWLKGPTCREELDQRVTQLIPGRDESNILKTAGSKQFTVLAFLLYYVLLFHLPLFVRDS